MLFVEIHIGFHWAWICLVWHYVRYDAIFQVRLCAIDNYEKFMVSFSTDDTNIDFFLDDLAGF